jgi:hypothetical protein
MTSVPHGASSVEAKSLSIGALLQERHPFLVPRYQRSYAWDDEQVVDFVTDIANLLSKPSGSASHFFGGVVCIDCQDNQRVRPNSYEIVDGQQRLATFTLALACVVKVAGILETKANRAGAASAARSAKTLLSSTSERYLSWKDEDVPNGITHIRPRLSLSLADDAVFQQLIAGDDPTPARESHELLIDAHRSLLTMVHEEVRDSGPIAGRVQRLLRVREVLVEDCHIIHIVSTDRKQAYRLFSVLNDRGESLSDADLLRSRSLELLEAYPSEQESAAKLWDEMLGAPGRSVEAFFRALYPSVTGKRVSGDLFDATANEFLPSTPPSTAPAALDIVRVVEWLRDELQVFLKLADGQWPFDRPAGAPGPVRAWQVDRLKRLVLTIKHELALPVLMAGSRSLTEKAFAELVYMLEIFAFRYKNICNGHASAPATLYYTQAHAMRAKFKAGDRYSLKEFRVALRRLINTNASDDRFREFLVQKLRYSNTSQRGNIREFLTTLEDHHQWLRTTAVGSTKRPAPSMSKITDIENASLEHIYPQNAKAADVDPLMEPVKHCLGNLSFFGATDNVAAANKSFTDKKVTNYAESTVSMTRDLASIPNWADSEVAAREIQLLDAAVRVFVV